MLLGVKGINIGYQVFLFWELIKVDDNRRGCAIEISGTIEERPTERPYEDSLIRR